MDISDSQVFEGGREDGRTEGRKKRKKEEKEGRKRSETEKEVSPLLNGPVFKDSIHGLIEIPPLCVRIIDTPQFQRLRFIKQLGGGYFVYPGAAHNRYEHSIGVCFLAGELLKAIRTRQNDLTPVNSSGEKFDITDKDILLVQIAGLCHDLGHGPFSHLFDMKIIPDIAKKKDSEKMRKWTHEQASVNMFDHLLEENNLTAEISDEDRAFIRELILGKEDKSQLYSDWLKERTHGKNYKMFLYEVVNNKRNEIDVDKWDYFARDCHMLGIGNNFDHKRCIALARVINVDGQWQICYRDKEYTNLLEMFQTRYQLHRRAYQHKTVKAIEMMIAEAFIAADDSIKVTGKDNKKKTMSEAIFHMPAYSVLTDDVFYRIFNDQDAKLDKARGILTRMLERDLYLLIDEKLVKDIDNVNKDRVQEQVFGFMEEEGEFDAETAGKNGINIFEILVVNLNYGKGNQNPINDVKFYTKETPDVATSIKEDEVSLMLPKNWAEKHVRIYLKSKQNESIVKSVKSAWDKWVDIKKQQQQQVA